MLFAGLEVLIEKNCALGLCTDLGLWPRTLRKTSQPANKIYLLLTTFCHCFKLFAGAV